MIVGRTGFAVALLFTVWVTPLAAEEATVVELTDNVLVRDTTRLGINLGGDAYYSGAALVKDRARENFEGVMFRRCHWGPGSAAGGGATWFGGGSDWGKILDGGTYTILSGPDRWTTGKIKEIATRTFVHQGRDKPFRFFVWDRDLAGLPPRGGFMVESDRLQMGALRTRDGFWCSKDNEIAVGDVPPGSFGCAALKLRGTKAEAHFRFATHWQRYADNNGQWRVSFWAKAVAGKPRLSIRADGAPGDPKAEVQPAGTWERHQVVLKVAGFPEPTDSKGGRMPFMTFEAGAGDVLIDDVEIRKDGDTNPTAFRDDCVAMLKRYHPGPLRYLQMGGSTIANAIAGPLASFRYDSQGGAKLSPYASHRRDPYSLHQMYELCEHIGAEPWYCLPGTVGLEEIKHFMEYLGAPARVGWGTRRAKLGHPKPWTDVFERIHVEFGNEAWNNAGPYQCGGFNGPDYWNDLFATAKKSPYFRKNVVFHSAGQAANPGLGDRIMADCPSADRYSVAPYIIQGFSKADAAKYLDTDDKLFRWAFAWAIRRSRHEKGAMRLNYQNALKHKQELSIYEVNHHTTHGDGPLEPRNRLVTSLGGGLNVCNNMLTMLKEHHVRSQCLFSLVQHGYRANGIGEVRLWGTALCLRKGHERYRPTFLACATANRVLGGDLVQTRHTGPTPTFDATGPFDRRPPATTMRNLPTLWSYGFADGARRGLILVNLDTRKPHTVQIRFQGPAAGAAKRWLLSAEKISDNNEFENREAKVTVAESKIPEFASGSRIELPAHSMTALEWHVKGR